MDIEEQFLSHKNNVVQKVRIAKGADLTLAKEVLARYERFIRSLAFPKSAAEEPKEATKALNSYVDFAKAIEAKSRFFNWRSNFAGSIVPEFLYQYMVSRLTIEGLTACFSTKNSVVEATFAIDASRAINVRHKDQDLCIGVHKEVLSFGKRTIEFVPPAVCCEVKTNIDINKLNGLDFSAERLQRSFPGARYFLITETIDFSLDDNYSAGYVDEVFVLRKQVRSEARREKAPLCADVVKAAGDAILKVLKRASLVRGHVYERLHGGKLINSSTSATNKT